MPRFSANLGFLFPDIPFLERFDAAARAGFIAVEFASPYEYPPAELRSRLNANGLAQVLINSPAGDRAAGERGFACVPGKEATFRDGVLQALDYAVILAYFSVVVWIGSPTHSSVHDSEDFSSPAALFPVRSPGLPSRAANIGSFELMDSPPTEQNTGCSPTSCIGSAQCLP